MSLKQIASRQNFRSIIPMVIILIIASFLRIYKLNEIPLGLTNDEKNILFAVTHRQSSLQNPVPVYLTAPLVTWLPGSASAVRLPTAILGIFEVLLVFFLGRQLAPKTSIGILSALVMSVSAWHIQISRFGSEEAYAFFFYLLGIVIFVYKNKPTFLQFLFALSSFTLALLSYRPLYFILIPVMGILMWFRWKWFLYHKFLFFLNLTLIVIGLLIISTKMITPENHFYEFFFQDKQASAEVVDRERRESGEPAFIKSLYHNKITYWESIAVRRYTYMFSPQYLFLNQGRLYLIELPLLIFGFLYLFASNRRSSQFILYMLFNAPFLAVVVGMPLFVKQSIFMLPWLALFIGSGIAALPVYRFKRNLTFAIYIFIIGCYLYNVGGFLKQFYYDSGSIGNLSEINLSSTIKRV